MKRIKPYIENKYLVTNVDKQRFLCSFKNLLVPDENGENGHYYVSSIYFDTDNFDFYQDKLEGEFFKLKIRIRRYSQDSENWVSPKLELKIKHSDNTIKYSKPITEEEVKRLSSTSLSGYEVLKMFNFDKRIPKEYLL
ncbi:MAG: VTC domain-containing protein, partial [Candidatus Riflebacteria bacterium]|nr:VTC domain-containing protein [Candidatus Riflebacteria bacterium]